MSATVNGIKYSLSGSNATVTGTSAGAANTTTVTIPSTVTNLGTTYNVTAIGNNAFQNYSYLTSITIPNGVLTIGNWAFFSCTTLASVTIGSSLTTIGEYAFRQCTSLASIIVDSANNNYSSLNNVLFNKAQTTLIQYAIGLSSNTYTIPSTVTIIGSSAFYNCSSLASVTIPSSVTTISNNAFQECSSLASVTIGTSVTTISSNAFQGCSGLASIIIPKSVTSIGSNAFQQCYILESITIGSGVTSIGQQAFLFCNSLASVTFMGDIPSIGSYNFTANPYDTAYYYPSTYNTPELAASILGPIFTNVVILTPQVPSAPTINSVTVSSGQAVIAFTAGENNGSAITGYEYSINNGTSWVSAGEMSPITVTGLTNGTTYDFQIRAVNSVGFSAGSPTVSKNITPLSSDTSLSTFTVNGTAVTGSAVDLPFGTTSVEVVATSSYGATMTISGATNLQTGSNTLSVVVTAEDGTTQQTYTVPLNVAAGLPSAPTITHATVSLTGIIYISFTSGADNGATITNYQYSADNGTTWVTREPVSITSPLLITGLPKRISYAIRIRAVNAVGYGAAVTAASQFIPDVPSAPTINSVTVSSGQASIAFTAGANNGPAITNYEYSINNGTTWVTREPLSIASPLVITGLTNGNPYTFLVRAVNAAGNGDIATSSSTLVDVLPGAPTITGVTVSSGQAIIDFTGTNIGSQISGYQYSIDNGSTWTPPILTISTAIINMTSPTSGSITVTNLTNGTEYTFRIIAVNTMGNSIPSNSFSKLVDVAPGAPTINSVNVSSGKATLAFTAGTNNGSQISSYQYSKDNGSTWVSVGTSSPIIVTTGLTNGTEYPFLVRAVNTIGAGQVSNLLNKKVRPTLLEAKAQNAVKADYITYGYQLQELVASDLHTLSELKQNGHTLNDLKAHFTTDDLITSWLFPGSELKQEGLITSGIDFFIIVIVFEGVFSVRRTYALNNTNKEVTRYNVWFEGLYSQNQLTSISI
jgi:hypothetical protein